MPEFRKDPVLDRWTIIAGERAHRPQEKFERGGATETSSCPFCAGNESMTPPPVLVLTEHSTATDAPKWSVRVVPNKYPALSRHEQYRLHENGMYVSAEAAGAHEVIIESPGHITHFGALSHGAIERILQAYRERILWLRGDPRWQYALVYKNHGSEAGASLSHIHSQIAALPIVPSEARKELDAAGKHYAANGRCIYCDILERERAEGARMILETEEYAAFCPFASRVAAEIWIMPLRHVSAFDAAIVGAASGFARVLRDIIRRLAAGFDDPAFNFFIHSNPLQEPENPAYHWHLELLPKVQSVAAFEWGSGMFMNSMAPEDAARRLCGLAV
jgi:UDPglucose--hexose-1-phosphate uridylyltransferase